VLGLHRRCTEVEIRNAYRILAKQHHPDVNGGSTESHARIQAINLAHETLSDPVRRAAYDRERETPSSKTGSIRSTKMTRKVSQDVHLRPEEFLKGATLDVRVSDPSNLAGAEVYPLTIPAGSAPGQRFRVQRTEASCEGFVAVQLRVRPDFRFRARGSDLRCDLRINAKIAAQGGVQMVHGLNGSRLRVEIPKGVARGDVVRLSGEGLPRLCGGRGDLLVRIVYQPEVKITRRTVR
jgi:curved DNA-binding protein